MASASEAKVGRVRNADRALSVKSRTSSSENSLLIFISFISDHQSSTSFCAKNITQGIVNTEKSEVVPTA